MPLVEQGLEKQILQLQKLALSFAPACVSAYFPMNPSKLQLRN